MATEDVTGEQAAQRAIAPVPRLVPILTLASRSDRPHTSPPVVEPVVERATEPVVEPVVERATEPVVEPAPEPALTVDGPVESDDPGTRAMPATSAAPAAPEEREHTGRLVRPYAMTGGRTAADVATISLEAQIQVSGTQPAGKVYRWEAARILQLAITPIALIELSARASIPIGVARVIVSDLAGDGALVVQRPPTQPTYTSLLEKVLAGVRAL